MKLDDLKARLRELVTTVEAAKRHVYGLPVAAIRSDTHGNKMALWCDNGMAGVGQVCVAVNMGEFPDDQLAAIAGLANAASASAKYAEQSVTAITDLEALVGELGEALIRSRDFVEDSVKRWPAGSLECEDSQNCLHKIDATLAKLEKAC